MPPDAGRAAIRRRLEAQVTGRVQGVGFRWYVVREASALGLDGWVANLRDGSVRCVAEGPDPDLERLLAALRAGPPGATVGDVTVAWLPPAGEPSGFRIRGIDHPGD
jgi:acylphosphatase